MGSSREIIIEYEHVRVIRKHAKTRLIFCEKCGSISDFISLKTAAAIFDVNAETLTEFINKTESHYQTNKSGEEFICLHSLLEKMERTKDRLMQKKFPPEKNRGEIS